MDSSMDIDMDWDLPPAPYKLLYDINSERKSIIIYMTEANTLLGEADYKLLKPMWEDTFKCHVIGIKDPTLRELDIKLDEVVAQINSQPGMHDHLAITFVGHGGCLKIQKGGITYRHEYITLKDGTVTVEEIKRKFNQSSCWGLVGKPIHVYIAACRGKHVEQPLLTGYMEERVEGQKSHFFTFYSSAEDNVTAYNLVNGCYFIQALVAVFNRDYKTDHLETMATRVKDELHKFVPAGYAQTAEAVSTLDRRLYFDGARHHSTALPIYHGDLPRLQLPPGFNYALTGDKMESGAGTSRGPGKRKRKNTENYSETEKNPKKIPAKKTSAKKIPTKKNIAKKQTKIPANKDSSSDLSGSSSSSDSEDSDTDRRTDLSGSSSSCDNEDSDTEIPGIISCDACHKEFNAYEDNNEDLPRFLHYDCKVCPPCIQEAIDDAGSTRTCTECGSTDIETCDDCDMQKKVCDECIHRMNENEDQESSEDSDHNNCSKYCYSEDELKQCPGLSCGEIFEADSIDDFPIDLGRIAAEIM